MKKSILVLLLSGLLFACNQSNERDISTVKNASFIPNITKSETANNAAQDVWLESLITATPQEGRELAITMARKTIGAIQSDPEVKKRVRDQYADNAQFLILSAQVVATEFQTVAEANNYWR